MRLSLLATALAATLALPAAATPPANPAQTAQDLIATFEALSGVHKGQRRGHAKGFCAVGEFTATPAARALSSSPLFDGGTHAVRGRFSIGGGNPAAPDAGRNARGLGLDFQLPGGAAHRMALLSAPVFGAATPEGFLAALRANLPDPATGKPDPARQAEVRARFPETANQPAWLAANNPPWSYATTPYFSVHTFVFTTADGQAQPLRFRLEPRDGVKRLDEAELAGAPKDFLEARLAERLAKGPVQWDLVLTLANEGDALDDPSREWTGPHREVTAGTLSLRAPRGDEARACDGINFDPNVLSAGVAPSADPVLKIRSLAYALSFGKRLSGQ